MQQQHSVLIAYGNESMLDGLAAIVTHEPDFYISGTALNCMELMHKVNLHTPEICIVGIDLPGLDFSGLKQKFLAQGFAARIILIAGRCENSLRKRVAAAGIDACLLNTFEAGELIYAIRQVLDAKSYFSTSILNK